ncbi:MAG: hypothetical protein ACK4WH_11585, partial [Phycisphaerales bacterium]
THPDILLAFLDHHLTLPLIAQRTGLSLEQLAEWANSPDARRDLDHHRALCRLRARSLTAAAIPDAIDALARANHAVKRLELDESADLADHLRLADTVRRTASAILRLAARSDIDPPEPPRPADPASPLVDDPPPGDGVRDPARVPPVQHRPDRINRPGPP